MKELDDYVPLESFPNLFFSLSQNRFVSLHLVSLCSILLLRKIKLTSNSFNSINDNNCNNSRLAVVCIDVKH